VISPGVDDDDYPTFPDGKRPLKVAVFTLRLIIPSVFGVNIVVIFKERELI
jgi:hypothetical protein